MHKKQNHTFFKSKVGKENNTCFAYSIILECETLHWVWEWNLYLLLLTLSRVEVVFFLETEISNQHIDKNEIGFMLVFCQATKSVFF